MKRFALALAFTLVAVSASAQTDSRTRPDGEPPLPLTPRTGMPGESPRAVERVQVGERAPEFGLFTAWGAPFHLRESRGRWVALFFTDRRDDLARVGTLAFTLDSLHVRTLAVCPEKVQALRPWSDPSRARMTTLADEHGDISALYGLAEDANTAARHGFFLIDPQGIVRVALPGREVNAPSIPGLVQSASAGL
jgi:peroxiredoxin